MSDTSRRFEALRLLQERGELPEDFTVAVEVRDDLSKDDTLRIATVENLQRQKRRSHLRTLRVTRTPWTPYSAAPLKSGVPGT